MAINNDDLLKKMLDIEGAVKKPTDKASNDDLFKKMLDIESMVKKPTEPTNEKQPYSDEMLRGQRITNDKMDEVIRMTTATNSLAAAISTRLPGTLVGVDKPVADAEQNFYKEMWNGLYTRLDAIQGKLNALPLEKDTTAKLSNFFKNVKQQTVKPTVSNMNIGALQTSITNIEKYVGSLETLVKGVNNINEILKQPAPVSGALSLSPDTIAKMAEAITTLQKGGNRDNEYLQQVKLTLQTIEDTQKKALAFPPEVVAALNKLAGVDFAALGNSGNAVTLMQTQIDQLRKLETVDTQILERITKLDFGSVKESIEKTNTILQKTSEIKPTDANGVEALKKIDFTPLQELKGFAELMKKSLPSLQTMQEVKPETAKVITEIAQPQNDLIPKGFDAFAKFDFSKIVTSLAPFESLTKLNLDPLMKLNELGAKNSGFMDSLTSLQEMKPFSFNDIQSSLAQPMAAVADAPLTGMTKPMLPKMEDMALPMLNQSVQKEASVSLTKQTTLLTDMLAGTVPTVFKPVVPAPSDAVNPMVKNAPEAAVKPAEAPVIKSTPEVRTEPLLEMTKVETPSIVADKKPVVEPTVSPDVAALLESNKQLMERVSAPAPEAKKDDTGSTKVEAKSGAKKSDPQADMMAIMKQIAESNEALVRLMTQGRFSKNTGLE